MFPNDSSRRLIAAILAVTLHSAWALETALAAGFAARQLPAGEAYEPLLPVEGTLPELPGWLGLDLVAAASPKRKPAAPARPAAPKADAPAPVDPGARASTAPADPAAVERYTRALVDIGALIEEHRARSNLGGSSELRAIGPSISMSVQEPWDRAKEDTVRVVLFRAQQALSMEAQVQQALATNDAHVRRHNLPAVIRERQRAVHAEFKSRGDGFKRALNRLEAARAKRNAGQANAALNDLSRLVGASVSDAAPAEWGTGRARQAATDADAIWRNALRERPLVVAANGSLSGIELPLQALSAAPGPDDLAASDDIQLSPEIRVLAQNLGNSPVRIHYWVRNNVRYTPGYGAVQSAAATLASRRGNAFDIASLLIALLRAAGVPARYSYGTIELPAQRVQAWLGLDVDNARRLLTQAGVPNSAVTQAGGTAALRLEHVWVKAWVDYVPSRGAVNREGDTWVPLDAAFKQNEFWAGLDVASAVGLNAAGVIDAAEAPARCASDSAVSIGAGAIDAAAASFRARANQFLSVQANAVTVGDVLGRIAILPENYSILLGTLPYAVVAEATEFSTLPDTLRWKVRFELYASDADRGQGRPTVAFMAALSAAADKRITLSFAPDSPADAQALASFLPSPRADGGPIDPAAYPASIPGYLIRVKAELRLDGQVVSQGGSFVLGSPLIGSSGLYDAAQGTWLISAAPVVAGEYQALALDGAGMTGAQMEALGARAAALKSQLDSGQAGSLTRDQATGELLWQTALTWFGMTDSGAALLARVGNVADQPLPSSARVVSQLSAQNALGVIVGVAPGGLALDAGRLANATAGTGAAGDFQRARVELASAYAQAALERLFTDATRPGQAVSAVSALNQANGEGQPVWQLDRPGVAQLDAVDIPPGTRALLRNALDAGKRVTVNARPVSLGGVAASGYVIEDSATAASVLRVVATPGGTATALLPNPAGLPWLALTAPNQNAYGVPATLASTQSLSSTLSLALNADSSTRLAAYPGHGALLASLFLSQLNGVAGSSPCERGALRAATQASATLGSAVAGINRPPVIVSQPAAFASASATYRYQLAASDPDGDAIVFRVRSAPTGVSVDTSGLVTWSAPVPGSWSIVLAADDGKASSEQRYALSVGEADEPLNLSLSVMPSVANPGEPINLSVLVSGGSGTIDTTLTVDGQPVTLSAGSATISAATFGVHRVVASARDARGTIVRESVYSVRDATDTTQPGALIAAPLTDTEITAPVDIIGSAAAGQLAYWQLLQRPAGEGAWREIARGVAPVTNGVLGRFDPTGLANDLYELSLRVVDRNGREASSTIGVEVTRELKVGQFALSFEDLNIDASGIPIRISRTYDSRRKDRPRDFGYGWSVDYQNIVLRKNMTLGLDWELAKQLGQFDLCLRPKGKRKINLTLPGGEVARFEAVNEPECAFAQAPPVNIVYKPLPGTTATLVHTGAYDVAIQGTQLIDRNTFSPFDPRDYKLTTEDGLVFYLTQGLGIVQVLDRNGNTLTYTRNGLIHSNGRGVAFERDTQGRIARVVDPAGKQLTYRYDAKGDLTSVTDRDGAVSAFSYNTTHGLLSYTDPRGVVMLRHVYDEAGRLIAVVDATGQRIDTEHRVEENKEVVRDRRGNVTTYTYDAAGNVVEHVDALGNVARRSYDAQGNELTTVDPLGHLTSRRFDTDKKRLLSEADPLGNTLSYSYNPQGEPLTLTDARGALTNYVHFGNGGQQINEALGRSSALLLDGKGNLRTLRLAGQSTQYGYDAAGNRVSETDAAGNLTTYEFDANGNQIGRSWQRTLDSGAKVTLRESRQVDAKGRVVSETDALGYRSQMRYDAAGNLLAQTDPAGRTTAYEYDARGKLVKTGFPDGTTETIDYDPEGNEIARTDRQGRVTRSEYDALSRLTRTVLPDGSGQANSYDPAGRLTASTDARGASIANAYDAAGRLIRVTDALGRDTRYEYDANGNRTKIIDPLERSTVFTYDALNRLIQTTWPDGRVSAARWRPDGRKDSESDANGNLTRYGYDALGRLTQVAQRVAGADFVTTYGYDEVGNKVTQTDALGRTTRWAYDELGRAIARTLPLGQTERFVYDANGNLTAHTDFNGQTTRHAYDVNDRLVLKVLPDGRQHSWTYTEAGQIASVTDSRGSTRYRYDATDRLIRVDQPDGAFLAYAYDANGNRTELTTPGGTARYGFDANNRLSEVLDPQGKLSRYEYDAAGNKTKVVYPNATQTQYVYDALNRIVALVHSRLEANGSTTLLLGLRYTLGPAGHRTRIEEFVAPTTFDPQSGFTGSPIRATDYGYDELYRLGREQVSDNRDAAKSTLTEFVYDAVGNRIRKTLSGPSLTAVTSYQYDANDRLTREETSQGATSTLTTYEYDPNGNTIAKAQGSSTTFYAYDGDNRLIEVRQGTSQQSAQTIATYSYDANGNRVTKVEPTAQGLKTTTYLVDENQQYAQVLEEREGVGSEPARVTVGYVYGDDLLNQIRGGQRTYYHYDALGSTRALSNEAGNISDSYRYEAFGNVTDSIGNTTNLYRFTGEQFDPALVMYYLRARYLEPSIGRLATLDTGPGALFKPASLHGYAYANADPVNAIDPSGQTTLGELNSGINTAITLTNNAVSLFDFIRGDPNSVKVDGIPTIWDYAMAMLVRGVAASVVAPLPAVPSTSSSATKSEGHHTIPVYTCGHLDQRESRLPKADHQRLHDQLYAYKLAMNVAGIAIDLLVYKKPTSRINKTPLQRLGTKAVGRAAIAAGLAFFYSSYDWLNRGKPPIWINLGLETPRFVGNHHSAPACQRP